MKTGESTRLSVHNSRRSRGGEGGRRESWRKAKLKCGYFTKKLEPGEKTRAVTG